VTRDGQSVDQLKPDRIRVAQRESEMAYHVFDGSLSVILVLEDVRRGDVIEYSYTRRGANPVFAGHYTGAVTLQETVPLRELSFRLLWPHDRPLYVRRNQAAAEPSVTTIGAQKEYVWTVRNVPPRVLDADLPVWYDPLPELQLSDFASWAQVALWGDTLFASPGPLPRALTAHLADIRSNHATLEARAQAALRYVQDEVRYLAVSIGVNSHRPYPIATVLRRGYGDCKDKVQLLIAMLRELGVPARPALVSTTYRGHIGDFHPTTGPFDHAIVQAMIDGRAYWLDPTVLYQRGPLQGITSPYGAALLLGVAADPLATIPEEPTADLGTDVAVTFDLAEVGKPVTMRVETTYRGRVADGMRARIRVASPERLQRDYTEYYAGSYPGIRSEAPPQFDDHEPTNLLQVTERYVIPSFWQPLTDATGHFGTLDPVELNSAIPSVTATGRTMPLAVNHPTHFRYRIVARLADGWSIAGEADTIVTPALRFVRVVEVAGPVLTLRYEYETLADHVPPDAASAHLEKLSQVRRLLAFSVTPSRKWTTSDWANPQEVNWPVLLVGFLSAGVAIAGAVRIQRSPAPAWPRGPAPREALGDDRLRGLGGWLALVGLGVCLTPVNLVTTLVKTSPSYTASAWAQHTTPGAASYHPLWAPTLLLELTINLGLLVFGCVLVWQFFRRQRWFPALFVIFCTARVVAVWGDALIAQTIPAVQALGVNWREPWTTLLASALWVGYMFRSRRVQRTFVN
jgi:transglutaminase-like putative cysteine protease